MKILLTGAGGMLGSAVVPALVAAGHAVYPTDLRAISARSSDGTGPTHHPFALLDVRDPRQIDAQIARVRPDLIMHLGAETDVDRSEAEPDHAFLTNAVGTKHVALACRRTDLPLVYISTAGVFDGEKEEPYTEFDPAYPINVYGHSKYVGEQYVQTFLDRFYIVRAGWMVGGGDRDHKFVAKIIEQIQGGARQIYAVGDKLGTPTYAPDFARCLAHLITTESYGLYHMACHGRGTRYDVAKLILEEMGRTDIELIEVESSFFAASYPAPRPRSEMMRNMLLDLQGWNTMREWSFALREYVAVAFRDLSPLIPA